MRSVHDLVALQASKKCGHVHLAEFSASGFVLAHTDAERESGLPLEDCLLHQYLETGAASEMRGLYIVDVPPPGGRSNGSNRTLFLKVDAADGRGQWFRAQIAEVPSR